MVTWSGAGTDRKGLGKRVHKGFMVHTPCWVTIRGYTQSFQKPFNDKEYTLDYKKNNKMAWGLLMN